MSVAYSCRKGERGREGAEGGDKEKGKEKGKILSWIPAPRGEPVQLVCT